MRSQLQPFGLLPKQARVIKALNRMHSVSQIDLAREFGITAASMSTMTARLIALGFIECEKDPINTKRNLLSLTAKGTAVLDDINHAWLSVDTYIEEIIGRDPQQELAKLTLLLRDSLGGKSPC
ncbi:MarR family winged helix-turn-helix transcriptional regulator [Marinomonas sp. 5E14-1]|uniref:MarR family winged helix-turn-helix transcriptional regulator n=1 Tax=Marinomonas sp. 5E14-1 TaxID=3153922 RepID=UPI003267D4CB